MAKKNKKNKMKLYYITDLKSGEQWIVMAKSYDHAEKRIMEEFVDYFPEREFVFGDTEESPNGCFQIRIEPEAL